MSEARRQKQFRTASQYLTPPAMTKADWERFTDQMGHAPTWPPEVAHDHTFERSHGIRRVLRGRI